MTPIHIPKTALTPLVIFEPGEYILKLEGRMIPEDVDAAFLPINQWIEDYLKEDNPLHILFRLYYYNTSSFKRIYNLCKKLNTHFNQGKKLSVRWEYEEGDESSKLDAEELLEGVVYPYQIVAVTG
jgi:hypothetical protein